MSIKEYQFRVRLRLITPILGSVPTNAGAIKFMLRRRAQTLYGSEWVKRLPELEREWSRHIDTYNLIASQRIEYLRSMSEESEGEGEEVKSANILVFLRHPKCPRLDRGAIIQQYHIAGFLKDAVGLLGLSRRITRIGDRIRTEPFDIMIMSNGKPAKIEFPYVRYVRGITLRGARSVLLLHEYINPPAYVEFNLYTLGIDRDILESLFETGEKYLGLLAGRHHECGKFKVDEIVEIKRKK